MSAPESFAVPGLRLRRVALDIAECAAFAGAACAVIDAAASSGLLLPAMGQVSFSEGRIALAVRPARWLLLSGPARPGVVVPPLTLGGRAAVVDLSSALEAYFLQGAALREVLARGCRLDLHAGAFTEGSAAATLMAQVAVTLAHLCGGLLLLTPATTAQHLTEWLAATARPFGFARAADLEMSQLCEDRAS